MSTKKVASTNEKMAYLSELINDNKKSSAFNNSYYKNHDKRIENHDKRIEKIYEALSKLSKDIDSVNEENEKFRDMINKKISESAIFWPKFINGSSYRFIFFLSIIGFFIYLLVSRLM